MDRIEKSTKKTYLIYTASITLIVSIAVIIFTENLNIAKSDLHSINIAGRQRVLYQKITKGLMDFSEIKEAKLAQAKLKTLSGHLSEWETNHAYLLNANKSIGDSRIDSLFALIEPFYQKTVMSVNKILDQTDHVNNSPSLNIDATVDNRNRYLDFIDPIVKEYEHNSNAHFSSLKFLLYALASGIILFIISLFYFVIVPTTIRLKEKSQALLTTKNTLEDSYKETHRKMLEITALKADVETEAEYKKIFIEEAPNAIAMFDNNMGFLAASRQWRMDYNLLDNKIIGKSLYEIFPSIDERWRKIHLECLAGAIHNEDETKYTWPDGRVQWLTWDIRPWYTSKKEIGGILIYTTDITTIKEKEKEKLRIEQILDKANQVARIGTWEVNMISGKIHWSKVTCEIHEVPHDYVPKLDTAINFFKEGASREKIQNAVKNAIEKGIPYDVEVELITAKGKSRWARAIGQPEMVNGQCERLYGVFHNINEIKVSENALNKANEELTAIFNVSPISIIGTDFNGLITHFNKGAENLLQYSASEMIGKKTPEIIHLKEEVIRHGKVLSRLFGKNISGFDVFVEHARRNHFETMEWTYVRKDGSQFPVQLITTAIRDKNGKIKGFLGVATDITEQVNNRKKLIETKESLEVLTNKLTNQNRQLADFAHITSHNLRSPVANLQTLSGFYKDAESEEERNELFQKFEVVIGHLASTLNTLVEVIQTKDQSTKATQELSFEKILTKTQEIISSQITQSGAIIKSDFSKAQKVVYNDIYLDSIFLNLVSNAIKYKSEERVPEIYIESRIEGRNTVLTVTDNGLGINMEKHGHKLFGLNKVFHKHPEAKGVGLYMTKVQIEAMGGSISASSKEGEGSTFTVIF
ncbi:PAS domain S-box protein [Arenibacter sp. ARW7G5Y1]|uniref:PAS domain S-box protein n=1 Tax=Arenibacter sp. ARW7G5Y1 TaxID=2135619 RepID=UPI0015E8D68C|nr:PAS domain S-box protein [Arenibacter sp. ARW7G5Y1]